MKIAYVGIDLLDTALQTLGQSKDVEILKIFTCPNLYEGESSDRVVAFAEERGIPYTKEKVTTADLEQLHKAGCDLLLCAGYYYRLPITHAFPMVNIHPAPLPSCRGAWPMPWLLLWGEAQGGVVFHKMEKQFDTGEILLDAAFPLSPRHTLSDYMADANRLIPSLLKDLLAHLEAYWQNARPQGEGRYLKNPTEEDYTVSGDMTAEEADRILRAFYGYPCLYRHTQTNTVTSLSCARAQKGDFPDAAFPLKDGQVVLCFAQ